MNPQPKDKPYRNQTYLDFLKDIPCIFTGCRPCDPHHAKLFGNGGMSIKPPDTDALPVIHDIHNEIHSQGEWTTFLKYWTGYSRKEIRNRARGIADNLYQMFLRIKDGGNRHGMCGE